MNQCHDILDLRDLARRRLPAPMFDWLDGGAETESTAERNVAAFDAAKLMPSALLNLALNWDDIGGRPIDASFYMSNATNERYSSGGFGIYELFGAYVQRYGASRMYGLRLTCNFGE